MVNKRKHMSASDESDEQEHDCSALVSTWSEIDDDEDDAFLRDRSQSTSFEEEHQIGHVSLIAKSKRIEHIRESTDSGTDTASDLFDDERLVIENENNFSKEQDQHLEETVEVDAKTPEVTNQPSIESFLGSVYENSLQNCNQSDESILKSGEERYVELVKEAITKEFLVYVEVPQELKACELTKDICEKAHKGEFKDNAFEKSTAVSIYKDTLHEIDNVKIESTSDIVSDYDNVCEVSQLTETSNGINKEIILVEEQVLSDEEFLDDHHNQIAVIDDEVGETDCSEIPSPAPAPQQELSECVQNNGNVIFVNRSYRTVLEEPTSDDEHFDVQDLENAEFPMPPTDSESEYENNDLESELSSHSIKIDNLHKTNHESYETESDEDSSVSETPWFKEYINAR